MDKATKTCGGCGETKLLDEFNRYQQDKADGRQPRCRECQRRSNAKWREVNRERSRAQARAWNAAHPEQVADRNFQRRYGISLVEYQRLLQRQDGACAICREPCRTGARLSVDHSHETGEVRGLLCRNCNAGLGQFRDRVDLLRTAAEYLTNIP